MVADPVTVTAEVLPLSEISGDSWRMRIRDLMETVERVLPDGGNWCTLEKAETLVSMVLAMRPKVIVEIGVWMGGSLVPLALAAKAVGGCEVHAIDAWSAYASVQGQRGDNAEWWSKTDHEVAYQVFMQRLDALELHDVVQVHRMISDAAPVPLLVDVLHVDGNHAEQAVKDVQRFAPAVPVGGFCIMDDIGWDGGHVQTAARHLQEMGFHEMYPLAPGMVYQRRRA